MNYKKFSRLYSISRVSRYRKAAKKGGWSLWHDDKRDGKIDDMPDRRQGDNHHKEGRLKDESCSAIGAAAFLFLYSLYIGHKFKEMLNSDGFLLKWLQNWKKFDKIQVKGDGRCLTEDGRGKMEDG